MTHDTVGRSHSLLAERSKAGDRERAGYQSPEELTASASAFGIQDIQRGTVPMNVLLIGEESAGIQTLHAILRGGHRLVAVMATAPNGSFSASLWNAAAKLGLQGWPARMVKDPLLADRLRSESVDIVLNVHSLYLIHEEVLKAPRIGAFNLHPGPLPRYAGRNTVSWAIYRGETTYGVTVHRMEPEVDAGPIVYQTLFPIEETDSALGVYAKCDREGIRLMSQLLDVASRNPGNIPSVPQNLEQRKYFGKGVPEGGRICWSWPAAQIVNLVRACDYFPFRSPWGSAQALWGKEAVAILKAERTHFPCSAEPGTVGDIDMNGAWVASADEWVLVRKIKVGQNIQKPSDLLRPDECPGKPGLKIPGAPGWKLR